MDERQRHWETLQELYRSSAPSLSRRGFLQLMSSSMALALASGCEWRPQQNAVQYLPVQAETPYYATLFPFLGFGEGILTEIFNQRPIKLEGHSDHEDSLGATATVAQAEILNLYHPKRLKNKTDPLSLMNVSRERLFFKKGQGALLLLEPSTSPWTQYLTAQLQERLPGLKIRAHSLHPYFSSLHSLKETFGEEKCAVFDLSKCNNVLSVDADLFSGMPGRLRYIREFSDRRVPGSDFISWSAFESFPTLVGLMADHKEFSLKNKDLILPGMTLSKEKQRQIWLKNKALGSTGIWLMDNPYGELSPYEDLTEVLNGEWDQIFNFEVSFPVEGSLFSAYKNSKAKKVHLSCFSNPTSQLAETQIPLSHFLESWDCLRSSKGALHLAQPTVNPLFHTKSKNEWLYFLLHGRLPMDEDFFAFLRKRFSLAESDRTQALKTGQKIDQMSLKSLSDTPSKETAAEIQISFSGKKLFLRPDPFIGFGEQVHNEWLMELPRPYTQLSWENAFVISKKTAEDLKMKEGEVLKITTIHGKTAELPVLIRPLVGDNQVLSYLGFGEPAQHGLGLENLRPDIDTWEVSLQKLEKTSSQKALAVSQMERTDSENKSAKDLYLSEVSDPPKNLKKEHEKFNDQLQTLRDTDFLKKMADYPLQWAMTIDLSRCVGCAACMIACQAENNIPSVGRTQILKGRPMHWIRVDHYDSYEEGQEDVSFQPLPCMHCEKAPCEEVCPVAATLHNEEGLNQMVYNRCIGTRFCENNCPYKVRRFNYLSYSDHFFKDSNQWGLNPEVSVRSRGVMEKCTYCVQRIEESKRKGRPNQATTACQTVCPAQAIEFGNLKDPESIVAKNRKEPRHYALLSELGTLPRTTYLARIKKEKEI